ncbi:MAG: SIS domain-containing protein [Anaerolineales bacterium]|nr:SIS domain-containing protein [Anaerolineales bacterium]
MGLREEIYQQTQVLKDLIDAQWPRVVEITAKLKQTDFQFAFLAARGTSDNAARYAKYLWGSHNQLPVALAAPSLFSLYQLPPKLKGALVVGISQSGQSPDIVNVVAEGKRQGQPTLAITNAADSPLAEAADFVLDIQAGEELAVAATKTYTAQLMALAMLSVAMSGDDSALAVLKEVPGYVGEVLASDTAIQQMAERYYYMKQCVVIGRGYNYSTAFEWSLKLKELTYVVAEPYSSADFMHGPIAIVERGFPVMVVAPDGKVFPELLSVLETLHEKHQPNLLVLSNRTEALSLADIKIPLPQDMPEWVSPLVSIIPAQLFSYYLTKVKGLDTEKPRGLQKVTHTR